MEAFTGLRSEGGVLVVWKSSPETKKPSVRKKNNNNQHHKILLEVLVKVPSLGVLLGYELINTYTKCLPTRPLNCYDGKAV